MRFPVHCCCHPETRLGYFNHPLLRNVGDTVRLAFWPKAQPLIRRFGAGIDPTSYVVVDIQVDVLDLVDSEGTVQTIKAIKSADRSLEEWDRIPGFERAS